MALNHQQGKDLTALLEAMGIEPEGENPKQLEQWVKTHLTATKVKKVDLETGATAGLARQQVKLSVTFAGNETAKGGCHYDLWKYEVECLVKDGAHREEVIRQAIRRSLKGEAAHVLKRLGPQATVTQILQKFDGVYGMVEAGEDTLAEFYSAKQEKGEEVSAWGCRLEELLDRAMNVGKKDTDEMLHKRFWMGLLPKLKEASRHKYDTITDFDRLQVVVRSITHKFKRESETADLPRKPEAKGQPRWQLYRVKVSLNRSGA